MIKPILVFGYGNPSRGDDAIGPLLVEMLQQRLEAPQVDFLTDFQLQIEHALDLQQRELVIFADAAVTQTDPFRFSPLAPEQDHSYSSHAMSPAALLYVYQNITGEKPPSSFLLAIKAESFELGAEPSTPALYNLHLAGEFVAEWLANAYRQ